MPHPRLEEFKARHHARIETLKDYALLGVIVLGGFMVGYTGGRIDGRLIHSDELARVQRDCAALLEERGRRVEDLADQLDYLTQRTTEAAETSAEAARAATTALGAAPPPQEPAR